MSSFKADINQALKEILPLPPSHSSAVVPYVPAFPNGWTLHDIIAEKEELKEVDSKIIIEGRTLHENLEPRKPDRRPLYPHVHKDEFYDYSFAIEMFDCLDKVDEPRFSKMLENVLEWIRTEEPDGVRVFLRMADYGLKGLVKRMFDVSPFKSFQDLKEWQMNLMLLRFISENILIARRLIKEKEKLLGLFYRSLSVESLPFWHFGIELCHQMLLAGDPEDLEYAFENLSLFEDYVDLLKKTDDGRTIHGILLTFVVFTDSTGSKAEYVQKLKELGLKQVLTDLKKKQMHSSCREISETVANCILVLNGKLKGKKSKDGCLLSFGDYLREKSKRRFPIFCSSIKCRASENSLTQFKCCSKCKLARYCSLACQRTHWKSGGHRERCFQVSDQIPYSFSTVCTILSDLHKKGKLRDAIERHFDFQAVGMVAPPSSSGPKSPPPAPATHSPTAAAPSKPKSQQPSSAARTSKSKKRK